MVVEGLELQAVRGIKGSSAVWRRRRKELGLQRRNDS